MYRSKMRANRGETIPEEGQSNSLLCSPLHRQTVAYLRINIPVWAVSDRAHRETEEDRHI